MPNTQVSSQTLDPASSPPPEHVKLDLESLPAIFVSVAGFLKGVAEDLEDRLLERNANLTYDLDEARIVLTNAQTKRRALFDLRSQGLSIVESSPLTRKRSSEEVQSSKRRRVDDSAAVAKGVGAGDSSTESEAEIDDGTQRLAVGLQDAGGAVQAVSPLSNPTLEHLMTASIKVVKVTWIETCLRIDGLCPLGDELLLEGTKAPEPVTVAPPTPVTPTKPTREASFGIKRPPDYSSPEAILARAKADNQETSPKRERDFGARRFGDKNRSTNTAAYAAGASSSQRPVHLLHETTSEHDLPEVKLPPQPDWVVKQLPYACQRPTPSPSPNEPFLDLLKEIRLARLLTADEIGVRAYSTSIAAIAAYTYPLTSAKEVLHLPGCDSKIANLWTEYSATGTLLAATSAKNDPELTVLRTFFDIWGVGATTAREFYYSRGWRDLDDIVEFGWSTLSRVQQIGVKFYDEFKLSIPRSEVEMIASVIHAHAVKVRDGRIQSLLVGGYRRGKEESGDVDLLLSHPDEESTKDLVTDIVASLEDEGWITHTLLLALTSTHRGQSTLPFRASRGQHGAGFDTLDKALVVWQDPAWPTQKADLEKDPKAKNPATHRRVDIIVSPWRTVGCGVAGWSGGTTFQRDLRRYAKVVKGWKFDSSGVRDRGTGMVVDVEGFFGGDGAEEADEGRGVKGLGVWKERAKTMEEAERRVFDGFGLEWRPPWERCTG